MAAADPPVPRADVAHDTGELPQAAARAPRFLNLLQVSYPIGAIASIGHRLSGVVLALLTPALAWLLARSLASRAGYEALAADLRSPWAKLLLVIAAWACAHHLLAGVRHLLMDAGIGTSLRSARASAWVAVLAALLAVALAVAALFAGSTP